VSLWEDELEASAVSISAQPDEKDSFGLIGVTPQNIRLYPEKFGVTLVEISALRLWKFRGYPRHFCT